MARKDKGTKEKILNCARELIKDGNSDFSMRQIAGLCNITQSTIYVHFKDKNELLYNIMIDDWMVNLEKMQEHVNTCKSFESGLVGLAKIIKEYAKPYKNIWQVYSVVIYYSDDTNNGSVVIIDRIKEFINILIKRFSKKKLNITNLLAEVVLGCASDRFSYKELENLAKEIID